MDRTGPLTGRIFNIQRFSVQDGPGIRTTVFMKGCPLACPWCADPESPKSTPELAHIDTLCDGCGRCLEACDRKAITLGEQEVRIDRELCDDCGSCVEVCAPGALKIFGREVTVEEVFEEVRKDELYYRNGNTILAVGVVAGSTFEIVSPPTPLFTRAYDFSNDKNWDVLPDGRFLMIESGPNLGREVRFLLNGTDG